MGIEELLFVILIGFLAVLALNAAAPHMGLIDTPNERKKHVGDIPLVGGIAFYIATFAACLIAFPVFSATIQLFLISSGLIVLLGIFDDYKGLGVAFRILAQFLIACILIFGVGSYIQNLGNIFGTGSIELGVWGIVFTLVATLSLTNAFNWTDGIDGLAGGLALNAYVCLAILFQFQGNCECPELPVILMAGILPFLLFNLGLIPGPVAKVFLGDAGSMFIGFSIIWLFVLGSQGESPSFRPITAVWIVAIPLWDFTAIVYRRVRKGVSPFEAGRDHLHHLFMKLGFSPRHALLIIMSISLFTSSIGLIGEFFLIPESFMMLAYVALFFVYTYCVTHDWAFTRKLKELQNLNS